MIHWPAPGLWLRWCLIVYGISLFIWLSLEDSTLWPVTLLGIAGALLLLIWHALGRLHPLAARWLPLLTLAGGLVVGLGSRVLIVALMFFKNARHAHLYPDYPPLLMLTTLQSAAVWALAGALVGLSLGLAWLALRRDPDAAA